MAGWALRALDGGELTKLVTDGQVSRVGLAIQPVKVIFSGRVAAPLPSSNDRVVQISYSDGPAWGSILPDMTLLVGSAGGGAGGYDIGIVRIRKAATSSILYVSECSDVVWAVGQWLTVIEDFGIWAKHLRIVGRDPFVVYMDWDVAYGTQHLTCDPVPVLGPHVVKKLTGATVQVTGFDGTDSWVRGSTITGWSWAAPGASATSGMTTATPTITYNAAGWYRVSCTVMAANTKTFTGYRYVYIYDDAHPPLWAVEMGSCEGDSGRGGWSFRVTAHANATLAEIRNRALVILFAEDAYGPAEGSVGIVKERENILAIGWIVGESIIYDPAHGTVEFLAEGPQSLISKVTGFPSGVKDVGPATPATWLEMQNMKVEDALWHFLHWRSTCTRMMDIFPPGTNVPIGMINSGLATLWQQLQEIADRTIKAAARCDHLGRLYIQTDSQFVPVGSRSGITILSIQPDYWRDNVQIERQVLAAVGRIDLAGVAWSNVTQKGTPYFSLAPGHVMKQYGGVQAEDRLALTSQAQANLLAGLIMGHANNPYPSMLVRFGMNLRVLDICPWQYATISIAAGDNPRGVTLTDFKLIPRRVSYSLQGGEDGGVLLVDVDFEGYTVQETACDGDIPASPPSPALPPPPPPPPPLPPAVPAPDVVLAHDRINLVLTENFQSDSPTWRNVRGSIYGVLWTARLDMYDGKGAWAVTGTSGQTVTDTAANVGVWRCDNIFDVSPIWRLVYSQADAYAARVPAGDCGTYHYDDFWGQLRSLVSSGPGEASTGAAILPSVGYTETGARVGSTFYRITAYGGGEVTGGGGACGLCYSQQCPQPPYSQRYCHAGIGYCAGTFYIGQHFKVGTKQFGVYGGIPFPCGWYFEISGTSFCFLRIPQCPTPILDCPSPSAYRTITWSPGGLLPGYEDVHRNGVHHVALFGSEVYVSTEDAANGIDADGALWGPLGLIEDHVHREASYVNLTAGNDGVYWCPARDLGDNTNHVLRDGADIGINSDDLFGGGSQPGRIGYIGAVAMEGGDGLIILRKDKPHAVNPNKQAIYWWDGSAHDKTGNLLSVIPIWYGSGTVTAADPWAAGCDNVGASVFVCHLP